MSTESKNPVTRERQEFDHIELQDFGLYAYLSGACSEVDPQGWIKHPSHPVEEYLVKSLYHAEKVKQLREHANEVFQTAVTKAQSELDHGHYASAERVSNNAETELMSIDAERIEHVNFQQTHELWLEEELARLETSGPGDKQEETWLDKIVRSAHPVMSRELQRRLMDIRKQRHTKNTTPQERKQQSLQKKCAQDALSRLRNMQGGSQDAPQ